ncbi:hypothetical protein D3C86_1932120 [compost metagenome]
MAKTEAAVIGGITDNDAAGSAQPLQCGKPFTRQPRTDTFSLPFRCHGERREAEPAGLAARQRHRREADMADDAFAVFRHQ